MKAPQFLAVIMEKDGTGRVIASGSLRTVSAAVVEHSSDVPEGGLIACGRFSATRTDTGTLAAQNEIVAKAAEEMEASPERIGKRISAAERAVAQVEADIVQNRHSRTFSEEAEKRLAGEFRAASEKLDSLRKSHAEAVAKAVAKRKDLNLPPEDPPKKRRGRPPKKKTAETANGD